MDPDLRDYIDSRDEAAEARVTAYARESRAQIEANDRIFQATHQEMLRVNQSIERRMDNIERAMIAMKKTVVITGITATLSTVFGVAAFNSALLSNMQASYDSGRSFTVAQVEVRQQIEETEAMLKQTDAKLEETSRLLDEVKAKIKALPEPVQPRRQKK